MKWARALYEDIGDGSSQILSRTNRNRMLDKLQTFTGDDPEYGAGTFIYSNDKVGHAGSNFIYLGLMEYQFIPNSRGEVIVVLMNKKECGPGLILRVNPYTIFANIDQALN